MRLLLDTHTLIWTLAAPHLLSERASSMVSDSENEISISAVSAYEIGLKRDRDPELARIAANMMSATRALDFRWMAVTADHAAMAGQLPFHHRDPWDRILAAQSLIEGLPLVSIDRQIASFGAEVLW